VRALLIPILACLLAGVAAVGLVLWLRRRLARGASPAEVGRVLSAHGPGRCVEAARLLRRLAAHGDSTDLARVWDAIELPLLHAIPDCPPDYKVELIDALDACARSCRVVETAKRLVTMRNSLLA
jgi:hypothetical protein